jgi:GTP-binding protein
MSQQLFAIVPNSAKFLLGVPTVSQLKPTRIPEIALVGRSNVGKSSLLNRVLGSNSLARTSATPGKTQEINLFEAKLSTSAGEDAKIIVSDLPGFGFAKVARSQRARMSKLTTEYIVQRKELEVVVLLNDSKRLPEEDEFTIAELAMKSDRALLIVLTKIDRLSQSERNKALKEIAAAYQVDKEQLIVAGKDYSIKPFWQMLGVSIFGE